MQCLSMWIWWKLSCWWWICMLEMYIWVYFVFCSKLVKYDIVSVRLSMNSWSIDIVVVMRCCCWWFMPWIFIIMELWCELSCCWKFWWNFVKLCWNDVLISCSIWFWVSFYIHILLNNFWERIWTLGDTNFGFWVKNGWNPKQIVQSWWLVA
jgi:hypothetical protein